MKEIISFHKTVRGHLHVLRDFPCEDYSTAFSSKNGDYHIAVVADGHGASECFRSSRGSTFATEAAFSCLNQFAVSVLETTENEHRFYQDILTNSRYRAMTMRRLTDIIIAEWYDRVKEDYISDPPTEDDITNYMSGEPIGENIYHVYGTTLIAALWLPRCLILIQQGDGRCDVFHRDGTVDQPIPWDSRCEENVTTSMCDTDVSSSIRWTVIDLHDNEVIACVLESDGVEDAYRDTYIDLGNSHGIMGGVHTFNKDLLVKASLMLTDSFSNYLDEMLPKFSDQGLFSKTGSGDDVSVAAIVVPEGILVAAHQFERDVQKYELEEKLIGKDEELRGKMRKHDILYRRMLDSESAWQDQSSKLAQKHELITALESDAIAYQSKLNELQSLIEMCSRSPMAIKDTLNDFQQDHDQQIMLQWGVQVKDITSKPLKVRSKLIKEQNIIISALEAIDSQIDSQKEEIETLVEQVQSSKATYDTAKAAFSEYDEGYQFIAREKAAILERISQLDEALRTENDPNESSLNTSLENEEEQEKALCKSHSTEVIAEGDAERK